MKLSFKKFNALVFTLIIAVLISPVEGTRALFLTKKPESIYAYKNQSIELKCCTSESTVSWKYMNTTEQYSTRISCGVSVTPEFKKKGFTVRNENSCFFLENEHVQVNYAGTYECSSSGNDTSAQLIVLGSDPVCMCSGCDNKEEFLPLNVTLKCYMEFRGNMNPVFQWKKNGIIVPSLNNCSEGNESYKILTSWITDQINERQKTVFESLTFFNVTRNTPRYRNNVINYNYPWEVNLFSEGNFGENLDSATNISQSTGHENRMDVIISCSVIGIMISIAVIVAAVYFIKKQVSACGTAITTFFSSESETDFGTGDNKEKLIDI